MGRSPEIDSPGVFVLTRKQGLKSIPPIRGIRQLNTHWIVSHLDVKRGSSHQYGYEVEVAGPCRVVYRPEQPKHCGAKVWIETLAPVLIA
jgi:hypothetical protein